MGSSRTSDPGMICELCESLRSKGRHEQPHAKLERIGTQRVFRGGMFGGYNEQDYECADCGAAFTHSDDKNDFGWRLTNA